MVMCVRRSYAVTPMAHKIAVIGGDGIGPEVTTVALDVIRAAGVDLSTTDFDLGGARYLRQQLDTFGGDLEKALAAYNAGPNRVIRAGGIPNIRETRGYVAAIMARLAQPVRR